MPVVKLGFRELQESQPLYRIVNFKCNLPKMFGQTVETKLLLRKEWSDCSLLSQRQDDRANYSGSEVLKEREETTEFHYLEGVCQYIIIML